MTVPSEAPVSAGFTNPTPTYTNNTELERSLSISSIGTEPTFDSNDLLSNEFTLNTSSHLSFNHSFSPVQQATVTSAAPADDDDDDFRGTLLETDSFLFDNDPGFVNPANLMNVPDETPLGEGFDELFAMATFD